MSDEEPVTRREFDAFKELARERQDGTVRELGRLDRAIDLVDKQHGADIETVRQEHAADMARLATQREQDLAAQRTQRETDQSEAKRRGEWTWQMKLAVATLAVMIAGLYLEHIAR